MLKISPSLNNTQDNASPEQTSILVVQELGNNVHTFRYKGYLSLGNFFFKHRVPFSLLLGTITNAVTQKLFDDNPDFTANFYIGLLASGILSLEYFIQEEEEISWARIFPQAIVFAEPDTTIYWWREIKAIDYEQDTITFKLKDGTVATINKPNAITVSMKVLYNFIKTFIEKERPDSILFLSNECS